jgi:hypothetical protein
MQITRFESRQLVQLVGELSSGLNDWFQFRYFGSDERFVTGWLYALVGHDNGAKPFLLLDEIGIFQRQF